MNRSAEHLPSQWETWAPMDFQETAFCGHVCLLAVSPFNLEGTSPQL